VLCKLAAPEPTSPNQSAEVALYQLEPPALSKQRDSNTSNQRLVEPIKFLPRTVPSAGRRRREFLFTRGRNDLSIMPPSRILKRNASWMEPCAAESRRSA